MPQTDNGSEYIENVKKKKGKTAFEKVLEAVGSHHRRFPPGAKTWQSDVENFHRMVEDEFYDIEDYRNMTEFLAKAYAYQLYFNFKRKNRYRGTKTPVDILKECDSPISSQIFNLPPIILDDLVHDFIWGACLTVSRDTMWGVQPKLFYYLLDKRVILYYNLFKYSPFL